jgi:hypothetical protein
MRRLGLLIALFGRFPSKPAGRSTSYGKLVPSPDSRVPYVWPPKKILCTADARCPPPLGTWDGERVFQLSGPEVEEAEIVNSLAGRLTLSKTVAGVVDI